MAEIEVDLRRMVQAFRITELQVLLGYSGKQKTGKKQELMERAMALLRNPSYSLVSKIKELHSQRTHRPNGNHNSYRPAPPMSTYHKPPDPILSHKSVKLPEEDRFHSDISLITLPFYDHISQILPPTCLKQTSFGNRYQEDLVPFSLSPQHAREITSNRSVGPGGVFSSDVQVQLRFAPLEKNKLRDIRDMYPPCLVLRLNGKMIQLPNPIPTNKQNADPKRPPRPLDLTWSCRLTPMVQNSLLICWAMPNEPELPKDYCYTINLVRKRSSEFLTQKVASRGVKPRKDTESLIKSKLSNSEDDIALTSLKVSLLCPLGKMRMTLPCCPTTCDHIQCFDARLYIMMNEKKPTWNCPVCDAPARFSDLLVDELFTEICKIAGDCDEILFSPDGSWAPLGPPGKDAAQTLGAKTNGQAACTTSSFKSSTGNASPQKNKTTEDSNKEKTADIDLIVLSDSDEEQDVSDNGSSIQPVRAHKRPVSAISSDSSLEIHSGSSSVSGLPFMPPTSHSQTLHNQHHQHRMPSSMPSNPSLYGHQGFDSKSFFSQSMTTDLSTFRNTIEASSNSSHTSSNPFTPYPLLLPTNHMFDYNSSSTFNSHLSMLQSAPQDLSSRSLGMHVPSHAISITDPAIIDFSSSGFTDEPLLDDSDIIPLD
ncbi:E3 SUMO-protein ligase PIAS2-like isoform X2 [Watersipora subatra]|uniref:E3 SUMO-protein ligase PIAS2-like isoform X2 n=1 Tax=Watersipora subatra TaxID=2589382 RepID=UPI00355C7EB1